jgi:hypothetical protein
MPRKVEALAEVKLLRLTGAVTADGWDPVYLRRGLLNNQDIGPILRATGF